MHKTLTGTIVSAAMQKTVVVEVTEHKPHPLYRKLLKRSKKFKADSNGKTLSVGDVVRISETRPLSKDKKFQVTEVLTAGGAK